MARRRAEPGLGMWRRYVEVRLGIGFGGKVECVTQIIACSYTNIGVEPIVGSSERPVELSFQRSGDLIRQLRLYLANPGLDAGPNRRNQSAEPALNLAPDRFPDSPGQLAGQRPYRKNWVPALQSGESVNYGLLDDGTDRPSE